VAPATGKGPARDSTGTVYRALRTSILRGDLVPQSVLSQARIARDFEVSRGPVREALRLLQRDGLINARVNQRPRVSGFSPDDLDQLYATRIVVEALAVAISVPRLDEPGLAALEQALAEMEAIAIGDLDRWSEPHRRFHMGLVRPAGPRMHAAIEQLFDHAERYRRFYLADDPIAWAGGASEHRAILAACRQGDAARAAEALGRHLSRTSLMVLMVIAPEYEPLAVRTALRQVIGAAAGDVGPPAVPAADPRDQA